MRIAFLGDSITEGVPKVSYFEMVRKELKKDVFNFGKGGDTVKSLHNRIRRIDLSQYDSFVLFIGVNDVYSKINKTHKVFKTLRNQKWVKDIDEFKKEYESLIKHLKSFEKEIVIIPPLILGEDITNKWNTELGEMVKMIECIVSNNSNLTYLDVRQDFIDYLSHKEISSYLPYSLMQTIKDVQGLKTNLQVDNKSKERGLHLTLDGCHLNSKGAELVSSRIVTHFSKLNK